MPATGIELGDLLPDERVGVGGSDRADRRGRGRREPRGRSSNERVRLCSRPAEERESQHRVPMVEPPGALLTGLLSGPV